MSFQSMHEIYIKFFCNQQMIYPNIPTSDYLTISSTIRYGLHLIQNLESGEIQYQNRIVILVHIDSALK